MLDIMTVLSKFLDCKLSIYENKFGKVLSLNVSAIDDISFIVNYFNRYPLIGTKGLDYKD
jgi:hypothetical protein